MLDKEAEEEAAQVSEFMAHSCLDIPALRADVFRRGDRNSRLMLARMSDTPVHLLEQLAQDSDDEIRATVSHNSNLPLTPVTILQQLAQDETSEVLKAIAQNPHIPTELRQSLQYRLRSNISPTLSGLSRLYNRETDDLPLLLSEYVQSSTPFVRLVSLMHPLTPIPSLNQGSQSLFWLERYAVANNPATPVELRQKLAQDSNSIVNLSKVNPKIKVGSFNYK